MSKTHRRTGARSARAVCCEPDGSPRAGGIARGMARPRAAPRAVRLSGCGARSRRCFGTREGDLLAISRKRIPPFTGSRVARGLSFGAPAGHGEEGSAAPTEKTAHVFRTTVQAGRQAVGPDWSTGLDRLSQPASMLDRVWAVRAGGRGALRAVALVPILVGLMSCSSDEQSDPAREPAEQADTTAKGANPLIGGSLYVDPQSPAALQ